MNIYNQDNNNQNYQPMNQQYQSPPTYGNIPNNFNMNVSGNIGVEKRGSLGKIAIILIIIGLFTCGITNIPGMICAIIAFIIDKHNATNIAAMVFAVIELIIMGFVFMIGFGSVASEGAKMAPNYGKLFAETKEDNGTLMYNQNDIAIYYNGLSTDCNLNVFAQNNSDKDIRVKCDKLLINGYDFTDSSFSFKISSGTKANDKLYISLYKMSEQNLSFSDINEIDGTFTIYDVTDHSYGDKDNVIDTFEFSIK